MKKLISLVFVVILASFINTKTVKASGYDVGYSEWSEIKSNDENEISAIQYGRKLPLTWSNWSNNKSGSKFEKSRVGNTNHYSYNGSNYTWTNAGSKTLFTWNFGTSSRITYFYADVDTYVSGTWSNYIGPPLYLYCDGTLIRSTGVHNHMNNWNPSVDCNCEILTLSMGDGGGSGRNRTSIVGTWATTTKTEYSYVTSWDNGRDWRFGKEYEEKYGSESQIPTERTVYSYPLTYLITYKLDGGTTDEELINSYTVLDEVSIPTLYKKGYEFIGFFSKDIKYTKIEKGTYGDLTLEAIFERKKPTLTISSHKFKQEEKQITIDELLKTVNATANDELDGDISKDIKVNSITYWDENKTITNPECLDLSLNQKITIEFLVTNSGDKTSTVKRNFYILEEHFISELSDEDIKIYTRYISEEYKDTLDPNSVWRQEDYMEVLESVYTKMKGVD